MPPEDLAEVLTCLRADAEGGLSESKHDRESRETNEATRMRYQYVLDTCEGLLVLLARQRGSPMSAAQKRLRPGELDGLVLSYLCKHRKDGPLTATAIAKGLGGRSAGAVVNCLTRLTKERKVRQPRKLLVPTSAGRQGRGERVDGSTGQEAGHLRLLLPLGRPVAALS